MPFAFDIMDFLASDRFSEALLQKILEFQHRQIVGAIKRGKYQKGMALEDFVEGDFVFRLTSVAEPTTGRKPEPAAPAVSAPPPEPPAKVEASETKLPPASPLPVNEVPSSSFFLFVSFVSFDSSPVVVVSFIRSFYSDSISFVGLH